MPNENSIINPEKYCCKICDYNTVSIKDYNKHLTTAKHKKLTNLTEKSPKISDEFKCTICEKQYKSRMGLWQHKKRCGQYEISIQETIEKPQTIPDTNVFEVRR